MGREETVKDESGNQRALMKEDHQLEVEGMG